MEQFVDPILAFVAQHSAWAVGIMFLVSFGESLAFLSLLFPGTSLLVAAGTLTATGVIPFWPVMFGAILGAVLGDWLSFGIGRRYGYRIAQVWPFSRNPELLPRGMAFFERHGGKSVAIGRFFGPIRAVIPLAAGVMRMRPGWFWVANVASALVWAPMLLLAGDLAGNLGERLIGGGNVALLVFAGFTVFGFAAVIWALVGAKRS